MLRSPIPGMGRLQAACCHRYCQSQNYSTTLPDGQIMEVFPANVKQKLLSLPEGVWIGAAGSRSCSLGLGQIGPTLVIKLKESSIQQFSLGSLGVYTCKTQMSVQQTGDATKTVKRVCEMKGVRWKHHTSLDRLKPHRIVSSESSVEKH